MSEGPRGPRTLAGYLLLPRPRDAVKWWIAPATFGLGVIASAGVDSDVAIRGVLIWFALELLIYQARYQWNDIRGFEADLQHPDADARGRLPGPLSRRRRNIAASSAVAVARICAVAAIALAVPDLAIPLAALTIAVLGVAVAYEWLRARATGHSTELPPPVTGPLIALWVLSGGGYAIRGVTGLALTVNLLADPALGAAAVITMWAFGVAFVTSRWALEGLAFARFEGSRLRWQANARQAREHTLALAHWLPDRTPRVRGGDPAEWRAVWAPGRPGAPWELAIVVAAAGAGMLGVRLAGDAEPWALVAATLAGAASGLLVLRRRKLPALSLGCLALLVIGSLAGGRPLLAALPWTSLMGVHLLFGYQCLRSLPHPLAEVLRAARGRVAGEMSLFLNPGPRA
jgi:hypothetical protein